MPPQCFHSVPCEHFFLCLLTLIRRQTSKVRGSFGTASGTLYRGTPSTDSHERQLVQVTIRIINDLQTLSPQEVSIRQDSQAEFTGTAVAVDFHELARHQERRGVASEVHLEDSRV